MLKSNLQSQQKSKLSIEQEADRQLEKFFGTVSAKYESGKSGAATISSGDGDKGGISYGLYQMSSQPKGGTVLKFITQANFPWANRLLAHPIGSPEFAAVWKDIAKRDPRFEIAQHDYIHKNFYLPMSKKIFNSCSIDLKDCSFAMQNVIWSCAVQHGPHSSLPINCWLTLPKEVQTSDPVSRDTAWITAIYTERGRVDDNGKLVHFPNCSPKVQQGLKARFKSESLAALTMLTSGSKSLYPSLTMAKMPFPSKG